MNGHDDRLREPAGRPTGGQFAEQLKEPSGLTLRDLTPAVLGPFPSPAEARFLGEVDLNFHPADMEWDQVGRALNEGLDRQEDPTYDPDDPWHGEGEDIRFGTSDTERRAA